MLTIRLSRVGKKNKPMYRLIISEKSKDPYGRALEILGSYNPHTKELQAKGERIKYWLSKGSQMSPTVNNLLIEKNIIEGEKVKASKARKKKKEKEESKEEKQSGEETKKEEPTKDEKESAGGEEPKGQEEKSETNKKETKEKTAD